MNDERRTIGNKDAGAAIYGANSAYGANGANVGRRRMGDADQQVSVGGTRVMARVRVRVITVRTRVMIKVRVRVRIRVSDIGKG